MKQTIILKSAQILHLLKFKAVYDVVKDVITDTLLLLYRYRIISIHSKNSKEILLV